MKRIPQLSLTLLAIAFLVFLDQFLTWGRVWEYGDFGIHHETVVAILVSVAIGVWLGTRKRKAVTR